jgi:hypothetical protein
MEIERAVKKELVSMLMEWVSNSRLRDHLPSDSYFIMFLPDVLTIHLSHLSEEYQKKHILPDLKSYSNNLLNHFLPIFRRWCITHNILNFEFTLWFSCSDQKYNTSRTVIIKKDDKEYREYLARKST